MKSKALLYRWLLMICLVFFGSMSHSETDLIAERRLALQKNPNDATARAALALALEKKSDWKAMVEILANYKEKVGRTGLVLLSRAYRGLKKPTEEISVLELANARFPKDPELEVYRGLALANAGRNDDAIQALYKTKETYPSFKPVYEGLLERLIQIDSRQEARDLIADMSKRFGQKPKWISTLCNLYTLDSYYPQAIETCKKAIKIDPQNSSNAVNLAKAFQDSGEPEKAKKVLIDAAIKIRRSEAIQTALADFYLEKKNFVDAYRWYHAGAESGPKSYKAQMGLALSAFELQKFDESLKAFTQCCTLDRTKALREFQIAVSRLKQRNDLNWQTRFEDGIATSCSVKL